MMTLRAAVLLLSLLSSGYTFRDKSSYPALRDVISFKRPHTPQTPQSPKGSKEDEMTIDIEKLDMHRIKRDDRAFKNQLMGGAGYLLDVGDSRRVAYFPQRPQEYSKAYELQFRTKMADVMLQLIYMARSKIKNFQIQGNVNTGSAAYRVSFIIRKMEDLLFRCRRYYITMVQKQGKGKWDTESSSILNLHHKIVMAHHDYVRLFFVQMTLHQRLEQQEGKPIHSLDQIQDSRFRRGGGSASVYY